MNLTVLGFPAKPSLGLALAPLLVLALCSCGTTSPPSPPPQQPPPPAEIPTPDPPPPPADRVPAIAPEHPHYQRVEATSLANDCQRDEQCFAGGCSKEMCSAEKEAVSTCEMPESGWPTTGLACGCVVGQCQWYQEREQVGSDDGAGASSAGMGEPCPEGACAEGLTCKSYYGIAGPRGPRFTSCEMPCGEGDRCPDPLSCVTIADGPGRVCRPR